MLFDGFGDPDDLAMGQNFRDWAGRSGFSVRAMVDRVRVIASFYGLDGIDRGDFYALRSLISK